MLFGILALVASGMSWTLTGAVMGAAPKKNVSAAAVQLYGALVAVLVGCMICTQKVGHS